MTAGVFSTLDSVPSSSLFREIRYIALGMNFRLCRLTGPLFCAFSKIAVACKGISPFGKESSNFTASSPLGGHMSAPRAYSSSAKSAVGNECHRSAPKGCFRSNDNRLFLAGDLFVRLRDERNAIVREEIKHKIRLHKRLCFTMAMRSVKIFLVAK